MFIQGCPDHRYGANGAEYDSRIIIILCPTGVTCRYMDEALSELQRMSGDERVKKILAISGSTRSSSSNLKLIQHLVDMMVGIYEVTIFSDLSLLPHFNPDLDNENPPKPIVDFRNQISKADGVIICTPEYIFSLPGSLKNALEWCVSTTIFSHKPVGLITASASGEKGHEELKLIMKTLEAKFEEEDALLIKGIKGKIDENGNITDETTKDGIDKFFCSFNALFNK